MDNYQDSDRRNSVPAVEPVVRWFQAYSKSTMTVGDGMRRFAQDQMQRNLEAWRAIMGQFNPMKMVEAHEKWVTDTLQDCASESQRLVSISSQMLTTALHQDSEAVRNMSER
jgi:hypothetical protein